MYKRVVVLDDDAYESLIRDVMQCRYDIANQINSKLADFEKMMSQSVEKRATVHDENNMWHYVKDCPKCVGPSHVVDTKINSDGSIRRRRECLDCGYKYYTIETLLLPSDKEKGVYQHT